MKTTRKLLVSVAALVMTIALATTATFAWFTMNNKLGVGGLDVNVTTGTDGIYFSLTEDGVYGTNLESADILAALRAATTVKGGTTPIGANDALAYEAVTTADGKAFTTAGGTAVEANKFDSSSKNTSFASFKIFFRANKAFNVYLDGNIDTDVARSSILPQETFVPSSPITAWKNFFTGAAAAEGQGIYTDEVALMQAQGTAIAARAANAARVSFVSKTGTTEAAKGLVWNPNALKGYNKVAAKAGEPVKYGNLAFDYQGNIWNNNIAFPVALSKADATENDLYTVANTGTTIVVPQVGEDFTTITATSLIKLVEAMETDGTTSKGYFEGSLSINLWLEGWDGECLNHIFKDVFTTKLSFIGNVVVAP